MTESEDFLRPAWKRQERPAAEPAPVAPETSDDDADLERGRTLALVAALGRLQMSLDVLARQQKAHHDAVEARLARIERALTER
jgi:hypothetical protein